MTRLTGAILLLLIPVAHSFQAASNCRHCCQDTIAHTRPLFTTKGSNNDEPNDLCGRRSFVGSTGLSFLALLTPQAVAGIDVSGLRTEGTTGSASNSGSSLADQLRTYDGSAATRAQAIKEVTSTPASTASSASKSASSLTAPVADADSSVATWALRASFAEPKLTRTSLGTLFRYEDQVAAPKGSRSKYVYVSFEFPSDWLQLDKALGCIQYVDQRNGDKLYLLRASLPSDTTLETVPKQWFGSVIFDPQGSISKGGTNIEDFKVSSSSTSSQIRACPEGACTTTRRRVGIKYATVTSNGLRVERRALADAYQVENDVYMLMTSSNANKFEAKGKERDTVEAIVESFRVER